MIRITSPLTTPSIPTKKEKNMLEISESAVQNLKEYMSKNNISSAIRVLMQSSCSGTNLGLGLDDDKKISDQVFEQDGVLFLVDKSLFTTTGAIKIDYVEPSGCGCGGSSGFSVSSENKLAAGSCSSGSCSSGSCGC
jgi:Fe-S cluster assembly iron-binding protein IscA